MATSNEQVNNITLPTRKIHNRTKRKTTKAPDQAPKNNISVAPPGTSSKKLQEKNSQQINQSVTHSNFSSRNLLRTAQSIAATKTRFFPLTMPSISRYRGNEQIQPDIGMPSLYEKLSYEALSRTIENKYYCMLCRKVDDIHHVQCTHYSNYDELITRLLDQPLDVNSFQMHAVAQLLTKWYSRNSLTDDMIDKRFQIIQEFNTILSMYQPECHTRLIGSLVYGASLKDSNINLELLHPNSKFFESDMRSKDSIHHKLINPLANPGSQINNHCIHYDLIPNATDSLFKITNAFSGSHDGSPTRSFRMISNLNDLNAKVPHLVLEHKQTQIKLKICCYAESRHKLAVLLSTYLSLDERACILSILVKYWARCCKIDNPDSGTLPPDAYVILVIYFLQRTSPPILPCLHEWILESRGDKTTNKTSSDKQEKSLKQNGVHNMTSEIIGQQTSDNKPVEEKVNNANRLDELVEEVKEEGEEVEDEEEEEDDVYIDWENEDVKNMNWATSNDTPIHELFIGFLRFMKREMNNQQRHITIRNLKRPCNKRWNTQVKVIEDPIRPTVNMSRSIGTYKTFQYIKQCFEHSYYYLTSIPMTIDLKPLDKNPRSDPKEYSQVYINFSQFDFYLSMLEEYILTGKNYDLAQGIIQQKIFARDIEVIDNLVERNIRNSTKNDNLAIIPKTIANHYSDHFLKPKDTGQTQYCYFCKCNGHTKYGCPRAKVDDLSKDITMSWNPQLDIDANFDSFFLKNYQENVIKPHDLVTYERIVDELQQTINNSTELKCHLELFGSTVNNLGCYNSDLDICMTLEGNASGRGIDCVDILKKVHETLIKKSNIHSVEAIFSARVPIIKFKYASNENQKSENDIDVDLSMYNQCATYNSKLLKMYTMIDERLPQLFFLVKRYAKACQIADASRGSLSSYAWSIMVIHYLQQVNPPILPVLQEPENGIKKPIFGINGWNVWFNDNMEHLTQFRRDNIMTLTQLFKGFFLYYGTFDFNYYIVSIRTSRYITRFQKNWIGTMMAVEDPFELTYNLAGRLDEPMAIYIMKSFAQAYRVLVSVQNSYLDRLTRGPQQKISGRSILSRLFDGRTITGQDPPFRGCKICHRIGHYFKDCPDSSKKTQSNHSNRFKQHRRRA